jgi:hypothetical protein
MKINHSYIGASQTVFYNQIGRLEMPRNIGKIDQVIRAFLGLALIAYIGKDEIVVSGWGLALLAGVYLFVTAIFSYCPLYSALGLTTFGRLDRAS